jgi:uncharacterized protein involved in high-affinity Fe2+ transport
MTQPTTKVDTRRFWPVFAMVLTIFSTSAPFGLAQDEVATGEQREVTEGSDPQVGSSTVEPAAVEPAAVEPAAVEPAAQDEDSPFDYRSSEEISEDLSVSFPVDI